MDGMAWFEWSVANPTMAAVAAGGSALLLLAIGIGVRLAFGALGRRLLVGLGVKKKIERENPWATRDDRAAYGLRPAKGSKLMFWRRA